jgi:hypothetical protein
MSDDETMNESECVREEADPWRPMHDLAGVNGGRGIELFDETGAELIDVQISRHEAEVLSRYWFERMTWAEEEWRVYDQVSTKGVYEAGYASRRLDDLEPYVCGPFRAELKVEAERRDEEVRKAHDAYIDFLNRGAPTNDPGDLE